MEVIREEESVRDYLQELFNTPQGGRGACPDFGMPQVEIMKWSEEDFKQVFLKFKNCIDRYEPRLRRLKSGSYRSSEKLVTIKAELVTQDKQPKTGIPVIIRIAVGEIGKIKVTIERY